MEKKTPKKPKPIKPTRMPPSKIKTPKATGRPTKYRPEFDEKVIEIAKTCEPFNLTVNCAVELGVTSTSINEWCNVHPSFAAAFSKALEIWEKRLNKFSQEAKMDYRYYKSFMWQVRQKVIEPKQEVENMNYNLSLADLIKLNAEY